MGKASACAAKLDADYADPESTCPTERALVATWYTSLSSTLLAERV